MNLNTYQQKLACYRNFPIVEGWKQFHLPLLRFSSIDPIAFTSLSIVISNGIHFRFTGTHDTPSNPINPRLSDSNTRISIPPIISLSRRRVNPTLHQTPTPPPSTSRHRQTIPRCPGRGRPIPVQFRRHVVLPSQEGKTTRNFANY